ncbi:hypothetical protein Sulba_2334 [Sulfurospirillum barnesii SES-3]|uniref:Uncharacterized protein n=1 Tax=Sulfurospirillum barnesii (strain ATCC 700032 / DSM 10660 / SES-3) TaxID=760154 RepID=I3Y080_SULBS|nr:hypothetical protein Sulba_2334 [Sulfurospirillum barnesii SES-3]
MNVLAYNFKGCASKSTTSSIVASYLSCNVKGGSAKTTNASLIASFQPKMAKRITKGGK